MDVTEPASSVAAASLAELLWTGPEGPSAHGVVPLVRDGVPAVAFTYADERVAREVAASATVALALSEPRSTGRAFRPLLVHGRPRLVEDPEGAVFVEDLLEQELRRFPPSRVLADSPLLRREHWWYLPRLVLEIHPDAVQPLGERAGGRDLLLVSRGERLDAQPAGVVRTTSDRLELDVGTPPPEGAPCLLFGQDASFPDLERWNRWSHRGTWRDGGLAVVQTSGTPGLGPVPGLRQRWRDQRTLSRACREALAGA